MQQMHIATDLTKPKTIIASNHLVGTNVNAPTPKTRTDQHVWSVAHVRTDTDGHDTVLVRFLRVSDWIFQRCI